MHEGRLSGPTPKGTNHNWSKSHVRHHRIRRLWGTVVVSSRTDLLPLDTEARLERFTELIGTAIANATARQARAQLAEEQAALRRVATLVAEGAEPEAVFAAG